VNVIFGETPAKTRSSTRPRAIDNRRLLGCAQPIAKAPKEGRFIPPALIDTISISGNDEYGAMSSGALSGAVCDVRTPEDAIGRERLLLGEMAGTNAFGAAWRRRST